jgi:hypothetical protein
MARAVRCVRQVRVEFTIAAVHDRVLVVCPHVYEEIGSRSFRADPGEPIWLSYAGKAR